MISVALLLLPGLRLTLSECKQWRSSEKCMILTLTLYALTEFSASNCSRHSRLGRLDVTLHLPVLFQTPLHRFNLVWCKLRQHQGRLRWWCTLWNHHRNSRNNHRANQTNGLRSSCQHRHVALIGVG